MNTGRTLPLIAPKRFVILFTLAHGIASLVTTVSSFGLSMGRFDSGAPPSRAEALLTTTSEVLVFPVFTGFLRLHSAQYLFPGALGWLPVAANSLLWAFVVWFLFASFQRMRSTATA